MAKKKPHQQKKGGKKSAPVKRKNKLTTQVVVVIIIIAFGGYFIFFNSSNTKSNNEKTVKGYTAFEFVKHGELSFNTSDGQFISKIDVEIADDDTERATGLMYRNKLAESQGMLFIFPIEDMRSFWMHHTVLSLDMIFVNSKKEIVTILKNTVPFSDEGHPSSKAAKYVVEVNAGYTDKFNLNVGDKIVWRRN